MIDAWGRVAATPAVVFGLGSYVEDLGLQLCETWELVLFPLPAKKLKANRVETRVLVHCQRATGEVGNSMTSWGLWYVPVQDLDHP